MELNTERLLLRTLDETAAEAVLRFSERNRVFWGPWDPVRDDSFYTTERQAEILKDEAVKTASGGMVRYWLYKKGDSSEQIIGNLALSNIVRGAFQSCHLGYKIDEDHAGNGYMSEALKEVIRFAFEDMALHRIEANIIPSNEPSLRLVKKLGFYEEGLAIKYLKINGVWQDHYHMVLRNEAME